MPEWGIYDMAVGKKVISAFSGPADVHSFDLVSHVPASKTIKAKKTPEKEELESLYRNIRDIREGREAAHSIGEVFAVLKEKHTDDWLLSLEIAEQLHAQNNNTLLDAVVAHLEQLKLKRPKVAHLITNGLSLIFEKESV
jgi:phenylalanine-4-hydroxylase